MAVDMFLQVQGIDGESSDERHAGWIDVTSFRWGVENAQPMTASGGGGAAGKARFQDLAISKAVDKSSPKLMLACASGQHIPQARLQVLRAGQNQQLFFEYTFSDLTVTSVQLGGSGGDTPLLEQVSFAYSRIQVSYTPVNPSGQAEQPITGGWDLGVNRFL